jgi:hypothetical protein
LGFCGTGGLSIVRGMDRLWKLLIVTVLAGALCPPWAYGDTPVSAEIGYVNTDHQDYGDGFIYGISVRGGPRRFSFGVTARWFENTINYETEVKDGGEIVRFQYEETFDVFTVTALFYCSVFRGDPINQILIGAGPQVRPREICPDGQRVQAGLRCVASL